MHLDKIHKLTLFALFLVFSLMYLPGCAIQKDRITKPVDREAKELVDMVPYVLSKPGGYLMTVFFFHDLKMDYSSEIEDQLEVAQNQFGAVRRSRNIKKPELDMDCTIGFVDDDYWSKIPMAHTEYLEVVYEKLGRGYLIIEIVNIDSEFEIKSLKFGFAPDIESQVQEKVRACSEKVAEVHEEYLTRKHQLDLEWKKLRDSRVYECRYISRQGVKLIALMNAGMEKSVAKRERYKAVFDFIDSNGVKNSWETNKIENYKKDARCLLDITADIVLGDHWGEDDTANYNKINNICQSDKLDYVAKCVEAR
ncbi:MAG: hypothetical protein ABW098_06370 [Candidatus Thiodiazotropha sp.]